MDTWTVHELAEALGIVDKDGVQISKEMKKLDEKQVVLWKNERIYAIASRGDRHGFWIEVNESRPNPLRMHANSADHIYVEGISKKKSAPKRKKPTQKDEGGKK